MKRDVTRFPGAAMSRLQRSLNELTTLAPPENVVRTRAEALLTHLAKIPIAILIANNRARYVDMNQAATRLTGYSRAQLSRMSLWDLTPEPNRTVGARLWRDFLKRGRMTGRYRLRRKDGAIVAVRYFAIANILPGIHVSAMALVPARIRSSRRASSVSKKRKGT